MVKWEADGDGHCEREVWDEKPRRKGNGNIDNGVTWEAKMRGRW